MATRKSIEGQEALKEIQGLKLEMVQFRHEVLGMLKAFEERQMTGFHDILTYLQKVIPPVQSQNPNLSSECDLALGGTQQPSSPIAPAPNQVPVSETPTEEKSEDNVSHMSSRVKSRLNFNFDDIGMSTEEAFDGLVKRGLITPVTNYVAKPDADKSKYCCFHRGHGHVTNNCLTSKENHPRAS